MEQYNLFTGHMLGDGSIPFSPRKNRFSFSQKIAMKEWVEYSYRIMKPHTNKTLITETNYKKTNGKTYGGIRYRTESNDYFSQERINWYKHPNKPHSAKVIPHTLKLNWEIIATWFADDGCNSQENKCILLSSQSFTKQENYFLASLLDEVGVTNIKLNKRPNKKWCIRIGSSSYHYFINNVKPILTDIKCLDYKTDTAMANQILDRQLYLNKIRYSSNSESIVKSLRSNGLTYKQISDKTGIGLWKIGDWLAK